MKKFLLVALLLLVMCSVMTVSVYAEAENLSGYAFATCSNYRDENRVAMYAIDGVIAAESRWEPTTTVKLNGDTNLYQHSRNKTDWLALEFEFEVTVSSAKIYWHEERAALGHYTLQYSSDGENWTDIPDADYGTRTGDGSVETPYLDEITFPPVTASYFRMESSAGETKDGLGSIYEFELYGDSAPYDFLKPTQTPSAEPPKRNDGVIIAVVIAVGVLCVGGIGIFTAVQLKKQSKGGEKS